MVDPEGPRQGRARPDRLFRRRMPPAGQEEDLETGLELQMPPLKSPDPELHSGTGGGRLEGIYPDHHHPLHPAYSPLRASHLLLNGPLKILETVGCLATGPKTNLTQVDPLPRTLFLPLDAGRMSEEGPQECVKLVEANTRGNRLELEPEASLNPQVPAMSEITNPQGKTSDYYRVAQNLPARFNDPSCFRGYRSKKPVSLYSTSNQTYGGQAPTVHEMPQVFYPSTRKFSSQLTIGGMFRNNALNVFMEKSFVTGPDNFVTFDDRLNFHPSYNGNKPSCCS
ncbi:piercer of microtubule wall 1 protein [Suncus etruscus]|uniref:piercer of microtubule wall 1 protein n=1 Tax=Suncus etruscus TaxID=109475 RepID=UPI00210FDA16|nr:piercer of microtubule wall 1 protein [Suncus etruscus]